MLCASINFNLCVLQGHIHLNDYFRFVSHPKNRLPDRILEVEGSKIRGLDDILEVSKMSSDALDSDIH